MPVVRFREVVGLLTLVGLSLAGGLTIDRWASSNRWVTCGVVVGFLGVAIGVVNRMTRGQ